MNSTSPLPLARALRRGLFATGACAWLAMLLAGPLASSALAAAKIPSPKVYVSSLKGDSQVVSGGRVTPLTPKSSFPAQGAQIETSPQGSVAIVLSNGTGLSLHPDTQIDIKRFTQEPFVASRTDMEREPSVSHTEIFLNRGTLAVSTSKLAAGSTFTILTALGSIHLHGGNLVVEIDGSEVKISVLDGEGTVYGGELDLGGHVLHSGEQAIIRAGPPGHANLVTTTRVPAGELAALQESADTSYAARKTVLFQTDESGEINALPVVVPSVPVQATVSPSRLPN